ncbi:MAG: hypothetical protein ACR2IN_01600 [Thermoleophilaceae bacterium]
MPRFAMVVAAGVTGQRALTMGMASTWVGFIPPGTDILTDHLALLEGESPEATPDA